MTTTRTGVRPGFIVFAVALIALSAVIIPKVTARQNRRTLHYVAGWTKNPPAIHYLIAGQTKLALPSDEGPWQWTSQPVVVVPGVTYSMTVGDANGALGDTNSGTIFCRIEVDGIIVSPVNPHDPHSKHDTSKSPGVAQCDWTAS